MAWLESLRHSGDWRGMLESLGFGPCVSEEEDRGAHSDIATIESKDQRGVVVTVHSDREVALASCPFQQSLMETAVEGVMECDGKTTEYPDHGFVLHEMSGGYSGTSLGVKNITEDKIIELTMDISGSHNTMSHTCNPVVTKTVPPGAFELLHHLSPEQDHQPWGWSYRMSFSSKRA